MKKALKRLFFAKNFCLKLSRAVLLFLMLSSFCNTICQNNNIANKKIYIEYKKKPFYFRFPPKLKDIKGKRVIMAKVEYEHPGLGPCSYEFVKDLERSKFFGWCNSKKIARKQTIIFELPEKFTNLPVSKNRVELGLNIYARDVISKINDLHKRVIKK